jgi:methionine biosynthesis protein MetW
MTATPLQSLRPDLAIIARNVEHGARVLDVGCGDGMLMAALREIKAVDARGLEIDGVNVTAAVSRGLSVVQGDADSDLADYPDNSFDYAILSQTLQTTRRPDLALDHLLRIGNRAFVSFPNFAQWRIRFAHMFGGRMPVTPQLPDRWYDTPNIHHVTIDDFRSYLAERNVGIEGAWFLTGGKQRSDRMANLLAEHAVFLLKKR